MVGAQPVTVDGKSIEPGHPPFSAEIEPGLEDFLVRAGVLLVEAPVAHPSKGKKE